MKSPDTCVSDCSFLREAFRPALLVLASLCLLLTLSSSVRPQEFPNVLDSTVNPAPPQESLEQNKPMAKLLAQSGRLLSLASITPKVGYYDMFFGQGVSQQVGPINAVGYTPVQIFNLTPAELATVDILFVHNPDNGGYGAEYLAHLADIQNAVNNGMILIIHDRRVDIAETILPGGGAFDIRRDFARSTDIDVLDAANLMVTGPAGTITNSTLDGGCSSSHGYTVSSSLPLNAKRILSNGISTQLITFSYKFGAGSVIYSSIPLDFYLFSGTFCNSPSFRDIYAPNVLAYANSLRSCSNQSVLILWDVNNTHTQSLATALTNAGMHVTLSATSEWQYDGTNPSPSGFDAVIHLNGETYSNDMPVAGQQALVNFVQNGGAYLQGEWDAFEYQFGRMQLMRDLILFDRVSGVFQSLTFSDVAAQSTHPVLANVPASFTLTTGANIGPIHTFASNPATVLMTDNLGSDAVAVRQFGSGRIVGFNHAGNYAGAVTLSDANIQQLYIDAIRWAGNCGNANTAPAAVDDLYSIDEDTPLSVSAPAVLENDTDTENDSLTANLVSNPSNALSFTFNSDGSFDYTPAPNFNGTDSFTYKANDGQVDSDEVTVTITVNSVNDPPVLSAINNQSVDELTPLVLDQPVSGSDPDTGDAVPDNLTFSLTNSPAGASIDPGTGVVSWTPTEGQGGSGDNPFAFVVRVTDSHDVFVERTFNVTVNEVNLAPELTAIGNQTIDEQLPLSFSASASDSDLPANTLAYSLINAPSGATIDSSSGAFNWTPGEAQGPGSYTFTVKVTDNGTPQLSDEEEITITVNEINLPPVLNSISNQSGYWGNLVAFAAAASDPDLPTNALSFSLIGAPAGAVIDSASGAFAWTPGVAQIGPHTFTVRVTDNGTPSLYDDQSVTLTIGRRPTMLVYTGDGAEQYSDQQALSATLVDAGGGALNGSPLGNKTVGFVIGTQSTSAVTNGLGSATTNLILTQNPNVAYLVNSTFAGDSDYLPSSDSDAFDITQEDARTYYTGAVFSSTSCATCSNATVTLAATIKDITAETGDAATDPFLGDIRNARVTFVNRDTNAVIAANLPVGLVDAGDTKVGTATFNWNVNIGAADSTSFTIGIIVTNYYARNSSDENSVLTVSKPLGTNFITGGGYLILSSSSGLFAGEAGTKNNFGFSVKYNKNGTNLQGNINAIVRNGGRVYQIKGNAMTSLAVNGKKATYNGKANIQDITDPLNPIAIDGNGSLQVKLTDMGEPGKSDTISITIWNKNGGLWFSSNWNGTTSVEQLLGGGNLVVR